MISDGDRCYDKNKTAKKKKINGELSSCQYLNGC